MPAPSRSSGRLRLTASAPRFLLTGTLALALFGLSGCADTPHVDEDVDMAPPAPDMSRPPGVGPDEIPLKVAQRCPGDPDCADGGDDVLYAGVAKRDITPDIEPFTDTNMNGVWDTGEPYTDKNGNGKFDAYWMAGYHSGRIATGVHDPVWARALAVRQNQTTIVVVSVDTLGLFAEETAEVEKLIDKKKLGIDLLLVHGTHLHETADLTGGWGPDDLTNGVNLGYQAKVRQAIADAATEAVTNLHASRLTIGSIAVEDANHDMHRYVSDTRDPVVIENTLHTLQFTDLSGPSPKPLATLVNWAHHPESTGSSNHLITSDFVGVLRDQLETAGAGTVVYVSGALGGQIGPGRVVPLDDMGMEVKDAGFAKAAAIGKEVAKFAQMAMADPGAKTVEGKAARLSFRTSAFKAQIANRVYHLAFMLGIFKRTVCCYDTTQPITDDNLPSVETRVAYLTLGPASIVTNPGELLPELLLGGYHGEHAGTYLFIDTNKKNAPDPSKAPPPPYLIEVMDGDRPHRMTFGLTLDFLGYIVPRYNFVLAEKNPYLEEAEGDHYEETNSIGPLAEPQIVGTMRQLVLDGRPNTPR